MLTKFVGPYTLKPGVALGRRLFPEVMRFAEVHFGEKLREHKPQVWIIFFFVRTNLSTPGCGSI